MHSHLQPFLFIPHDPCIKTIWFLDHRSLHILQIYLQHFNKIWFVVLRKCLMKFAVIYIIFCCNFIYIVECQCKNCYAFIKTAKIEYLLIKEAFSYSQIFYCLVNAWFLSLGCMRTCNIFSFRCMRTCNILSVGVCGVVNMPWLLSLVNVYSTHFYHSSSCYLL